MPIPSPSFTPLDLDRVGVYRRRDKSSVGARAANTAPVASGLALTRPDAREGYPPRAAPSNEEEAAWLRSRQGSFYRTTKR